MPGNSLRSCLVVLALAGLASAGCSTTRSVRPVGEGRFGGGLSVGGPVFTNLGAPIPTPLVSVFGRYGVGPKTDVDVGLHLPVIRSVGLDVGASHLVLEPAGFVPAVMVGGRLYFYGNVAALTGPRTDGGTFGFAPRVYEEVQATASWEPTPQVLLWAGLNVFAQVETASFRPSLLAGLEFKPIPEFGVALELKQMSFLENQQFAVVDFIGPGNFGAFAVMLGFRYQQRSTP